MSYQNTCAMCPFEDEDCWQCPQCKEADRLDAALGCPSRWFSGYIEPIDEEDFYFESLCISPVPPEVLYGLETIEEDDEPMCVD